MKSPPVQTVAKDVSLFQSDVSKTGSINQQNGKVVKSKHAGKPRKHQDIQFKTTDLKREKQVRKKMKRKTNGQQQMLSMLVREL